MIMEMDSMISLEKINKMDKLNKYIEELIGAPLTDKQKLIIQALAKDDIVLYSPSKEATETVEEYVDKVVKANSLTPYDKMEIMKRALLLHYGGQQIPQMIPSLQSPKADGIW